MGSLDLDYIMNTLKSYGEEYFTKGNNSDKNSAALHGTAVSTRKGSKTEDQICVFNEVPPFILALMRELAKNLLEQQKNTIDDLKENYDTKLKDRDDTIAVLKSELRTHRNEQDALASYNRGENLKSLV